MSRIAQFILVVGILFIVAMTGYGIVSVLQSTTRPTANLTSELATEFAQVVPQATPTIYPSSATVVRAVRSIARLETVSYSIEKVIVAEENQGPFGFLFGDRMLLVAHGEVIAGVDLGRVRPDDIRVTNEGRAFVTLPAAEIFIATLDNDRTYVYDREIGILSQGDINLETAARRAAEDEIEKAALEDGILDTAERNAEIYLTQLLLSLGLEEVTFIRATPEP